MKKLINSLFNWLFKDQLKQIEISKTNLDSMIRTHDELMNRQLQYEDKLRNTVGNIDVACDVHMRSNSWAIISIHGVKEDYVKFIDLGTSEIRQIQQFLKRFDNSRVNADLPNIPKDLFFRI